MPVLNWIGEEAVFKHRKEVPFRLTRKEIGQADDEMQHIAASGTMPGRPFICAWVVGKKVVAGVERDRQFGNPAHARARAATFTLVDTANVRLLKRRTVPTDRHGGSSADGLLNRVFSQPTQNRLGI